MEKTRDELRNELFDMYFEEKEGVSLSDLAVKMIPIYDTYAKFKKLLIEKIRCYDSFNRLEMVKELEKNHHKYLIIKEMPMHYIIIDFDTNQTVEREKALQLFDANFFIDHFEERKDEESYFPSVYQFKKSTKSTKDLKEIIEFYKENEQLFSYQTEINLHYGTKDAYTYLNISLTEGDVQLGFHTPDQYLYEHLFMNRDLTPYGMQDAQEKITLERMSEMFDQIKEAKIPYSYISKKLYLEVLSDENTKEIEGLGSKIKS